MATKIRLGSADAALVFRQNGTVEAVMPTTAIGDNALTAEALFWAWSDAGTMELIVERLRASHADA